MILTKRLYSGPILKEMDAEAEQKRWVEWFTQASVWCEQVEHMASNQYAGISRKQKKKKKREENRRAETPIAANEAWQHSSSYLSLASKLLC